MYTDQGKIEKYLQTTIDSSMTATLNDWIAAVKIWIDKYVGKSFEGVSETRYFNGNGLDTLLIDDFIGTPVIELLDSEGNVDSTLDSGDYLVYPLNTTVKNTIALSVGAPYSRFSSWQKRVKVTAVFGYSAAVPKDVELAATMLVSRIFNGGSTDGTVKSESLGDYSITYGEIDSMAELMGVTSILDHYRDIEI